MDLETENRIASMLLEEARKLRAQAEKEGVQAYLNKPNVRARPNSRFLTATVLGVQQANRAVDVNEMWRAREKEIELENKQNKSKSKERETKYNERESSYLRIEQEKRKNLDASCSSRNYENSNSNSDEDRGFRDDEIEEFLRSRRKRGRGEIGSRMDEPGPYLTAVDHSDELLLSSDLRFKEGKVVGPEKPSILKSKSSEKVREKEDRSGSKDKKDKKRKKKREEKKKKKEKRSKHHHKRRRKGYDD